MMPPADSGCDIVDRLIPDCAELLRGLHGAGRGLGATRRTLVTQPRERRRADAEHVELTAASTPARFLGSGRLQLGSSLVTLAGTSLRDDQRPPGRDRGSAKGMTPRATWSFVAPTTAYCRGPAFVCPSGHAATASGHRPRHGGTDRRRAPSVVDLHSRPWASSVASGEGRLALVRATTGRKCVRADRGTAVFRTGSTGTG